ncbi:metallophosphoesterase [Candidatus Sulfurimonas baltica]|uniref:Metallophosphoesterase n=1 Tax=Candidatus Sulfurimonas baltica TaxID=2740404 RepID=A0A7S7LUM5_9BACT|nr:metallophosphoesterase [Candidatus Sulfurimonas baltica]QOY51713.1 metallophosphoesterase [Candidatus Sulfurimonas baltica]
MKISILHLSDLHFKKDNNKIIEKETLLFDAFKNEISQYEHLFITITGDIAYSGLKEEYALVKSFLNRLENRIFAYNKKIKIEYIFCAGNHDCDFSIPQKARNMLIENIIKAPLETDDELVEVCTSVQKQYFDFIKEFSSYKNINETLSNKLISRYEYSLSEYNIAFNSFNTAWVSKLPEKQSEIIYPLNYIKSDEIIDANFSLTFSLLHHPFHWLKHSNMRDFKEYVDSLSDIILTGHEHSDSATQRENIYNGNKTEHIEGGTLQDSYDEGQSKFNLILLDLANKKHDILIFDWQGDHYSKTKNESIDVHTNNKCLFPLKQNYKEKIASLGLKVNHPRKDNVILEDLFVFPDLKIIDIQKNKKNSFLEISSEQLSKQTNLGLNILYGSDNSGKTTLAHMLQFIYKQKGLVPIIINGKDFRSGDYEENKIALLIKRIFKLQYLDDKKNVDLFEQTDVNEILLIIDDFQNVRLNSAFKGVAIDSILKLNYKNVLILSSEILKFEATSESNLAMSLQDFTHYQILEFGHRLRDKLITKWIRLGQETEIENSELVGKRRTKANAINQTIGLNIVPSHPVYLLTLLQAMEVNDTSLDKSSYGHYYHYMILQYLNSDKNKVMEHKDINTIFTYTSTLAFNMFQDRNYSYTLGELNGFDNDYRKDIDFEPTFNILEKLIKSNVLIEYENEYKFSHKYIYYYFVGHYFSQNTDDYEITSIIKKMTERLYRTEFANILMFILHLSPKTNIIEMLNNEARKIFSDIAEFSFANEELVNINACIKEDTSHRLSQRTFDESRDIELSEKDEEAELKRQIYLDDQFDVNYDEEIQQLDFFKKINLAFKLIEILGEIVKNYSGSLKGNIKSELIKNTYGVGLRSLKTIILLFEEEHDNLVDAITKVITKKKMIAEDKINEAVYGIVFGLASSISTDIVKRISKSIASKDLKKTYKRISEEQPENIAYQLIKLAIDLDFASGLNVKNIEQLHKKLSLEKNTLTDSSLKKLVLDHLYMFESPISEKTSICKKLGIEVGESKNKLIQHHR